MIDPTPISPLLDGFTIGNPVNDHFGVCCFPAIRENSDRKYIIKVISIPASQTQLDALLITGAYRDPAQAAEYFHTLSNDIVQEAELLTQLSRLYGFLPFEGCQVEPMQHNRIGYDVYLLAGFRLSLERYMHRQNVTHLEAVNLGIDLCAALAACRKAGMLYIDLKPSNIYISTRKEFKIGDLGFVPLDALKFTPMPAKYRSMYTAPELMDDLSVMNTTADTYALGMILYQLFNNGILPGNPAAQFPAPMHADEDISAIIMKAIAPKAEDRWEDPEQMGQALIAYLQAGTVNNTPIMAPMTGSAQGRGVTTFETAKFPVPTEAQIQAQQEEAPQAAEEESPVSEEIEEDAAEEAAVEIAAESEGAVQAEECDVPAQAEAEEAEISETEEEPAAETPVEDTEEVLEASAEDESAQNIFPDFMLEIPAEEASVREIPAVEIPAEEVPVEKAPAEEIPAAEVPIEMMSAQEFAASIEAAAAAEFAALSGDVFPEETASAAFNNEEQLDTEISELNQILEPERPAPKVKKKHPNIKPVVVKQEKKKGGSVRFLISLLVICLVLTCGVWGYMFYTTEYLQNIRALSITGTLNEMVVSIDSDISDNLLTVTCSDAYGRALSQRVRDGKAVFQNLSPASLYNVKVEIVGLHKLVGTTSDIFTTESVTNVVAFTAAAGTEDGSVTLNLVVEGHDPDQWQIIYTAEGEPELGHTFTGHTTTINNLTLDKIYSFRLETSKHEAVNGQNTVDFVPGKAIFARDLSVVSCRDGNLVVQWDSAMQEYAPTWRVHCTGPDYDETQELTGYQATFTGVDVSKAYTVEVTAVGMTQTVRVAISANPITLQNPTVDDSNPEELKLSWDFEGNAPEGGWLLQYTLDGSNIPSVLKCEDASVTVVPRIPGAVYHFTVQAANGASVFNGVHTYACPQATSFEGYGITAGRITVQLLPTPETEGWNFSTVDRNIFTGNFPVNKPISMVLHSQIDRFFLDNGDIHILYVYRDENGNALTELIGEDTVDWHELWIQGDYHYAERDLPTIPVRAGNYTLDIYFNGMYVTGTSVGVY